MFPPGAFLPTMVYESMCQNNRYSYTFPNIFILLILGPSGYSTNSMLGIFHSDHSVQSSRIYCSMKSD